MSVTALRPLRVGEILDAGIKLYVRNARTLMALTACVVVPLQLLSAIVLMSTVSNGDQVPTGFGALASRTSTSDTTTSLGAQATLLVVGILVSALTTAACVRAVSDLYAGRDADMTSSLRFAARRILPLLTMEVLYFLGLSIAFVALIIPGIWLYVAWSVAAPALLIERTGPVRSLGRSRRLVKGRWRSTAAVLIVAAVMVALLSGAFEALLVAIALTSNPSALLAVVVVTLASGISTVVVEPFRAAVTTVLYYDLRIRHEGYDLELLAEQLGLPLPDPSDLPAPAPGTEHWTGAWGPELVGQPGGPPYWPPPPWWTPPQ
jgi:hypothetical protein